jgi:hypothetical protein
MNRLRYSPLSCGFRLVKGVAAYFLLASAVLEQQAVIRADAAAREGDADIAMRAWRRVEI